MRGKRAKQYRKLMHQYQLHFSFREPYQVLLDAQIIQDAAKFKMKLGSLLSNTLHGEIKPMITQCCIRHLYNHKPSDPSSQAEKAEKEGWIEVAKQAERRRCGHHELEQPLSALECMISAVDPKGSGTNRNRYVVATQDPEIRAKMRGIAGVPLVYINRSVMILEPISSSSQQVKDADEKGKIRAGLKGRRQAANVGVKRKREDDDEQGVGDVAEDDAMNLFAQKEPVPKKQKRKGPKLPNPLSVKKAKAERDKPVTREVEDDRSTIRKVVKKDPQAAEKAVDAEAVVDGNVGATPEAPTKRKRKRKPKDHVAGSEAVAATGEDG